MFNNSDIQLKPCAYLHNYRKRENDPLTDEIYEYYIDKAPVYAKGDVERLRDFIKKHIKYGDKKRSFIKLIKGELDLQNRCKIHFLTC